MSLIESVRAILPPRYREFAKFLVVGGTAWIVDTTLFTVLAHTVLSEKILTCKIISMLVSTILSYILNREWSFATRGGRSIPHEALLFFLFNGIGFALNLAPLAISHYLIGINLEHGYGALTVAIADWVSANVIGTFFGMIFRYWSYRTYVFPDELSPATPSGERVVDEEPPAEGITGYDAVRGEDADLPQPTPEPEGRLR